MHKGSQSVWRVLVVLIALGTLAGLVGAIKRANLEERNKTVDIGLEYDEVSRLAQISQRPVEDVLKAFKEQGVTSVIVSEDLLASLESTGQARATRVTQPNGSYYTYVRLDTPVTLKRIQDALNAREIATPHLTSGVPANGNTVFDIVDSTVSLAAPTNTTNNTTPLSPDSPVPGAQAIAVSYEYLNLRSLGLGLPPDSVRRIAAAKMELVGRIGNFPGVSPTSAQNVLKRLRNSGVKLVIFNGDEVLGYRGLEKSVASMFRNPAEFKPEATPRAPAELKPGEPSPSEPAAEPALPPTGLVYGAVELGKQKGDETLSATLHGDFIRVHAIQVAEMGQLDKNEIIDRFARAARERNIRFCYVRLWTTAGTSGVGPLEQNTEFVRAISQGIAHGSPLIGGGFQFGSALRYGDMTQSRLLQTLLFGLLALGTAAGGVWMLREMCPLPTPWQRLLLIALSGVCVTLAVVGGEAGRKVVALLAGIAFPAIACLRTFPGAKDDSTAGKDAGNGMAGNSSPPNLTVANFSSTLSSSNLPESAAPVACLLRAVRAIGYASVLTLIGIVHVVGLLSTRPFMMHANQFLGIKAQHAMPLLIVAFIALIDGVPKPGETWARWKRRAESGLRQAYAEPARFGILLLGLIALAAFMIIVARTGNDSGVGASGTEMKLRGILDRILPVRPRTKEFLVGHPAFVLALAWWWRGRRGLAIPAFVVGSIGQVSLLNTFCHIHTPLIISLWRDVLGLILGIGLGAFVFLIGERVLPEVTAEKKRRREEEEQQREPAFPYTTSPSSLYLGENNG